MNKLKLLFIVLLSLSGKMAFSQIDTLFWFGAPWVTPDHDRNYPMAFRISTFGSPTTVRIQQPASTYDTTFTVAANSLFTKSLTHMILQTESRPADVVLNKGFKITSDNPITVVYEFISDTISGGTGNNPETYSLKGQNGMGTEFVVPFQTLWNNRTLGGDVNGDGVVTQPYQYFTVTATEDNTVVYITPRCNVVGGHTANVTYSVNLMKGQSYTCQNVTQVTNVVGQNLSGSIVVANHPVAVVVNDDSVNPSGGGGCYDLMGDQIVPVDVIGKEYIVNKGFLNAGSNESIFAVAVENFTTVTFNNGVTTVTTTLNQGDTYPYSITQNLNYVNADKPIVLIHMSGYGCELGQAILPPLNCSGSDQVTFSRTNGQQFLLNLLCKNGAQGSFTINGNAALVPAASFNPVPGTGGAWVGAQIAYTTAQIPAGAVNVIANSTDLFAMGVINGGPSTGCLYHYMSSFIRRVYTKAGNDTTLCTGSSTVNLNGSVTGGATTGLWSVLNGGGTLATPTNLVTTYQPSASDYAQGFVDFVLESTGNCEPVRDSVRVSFIQSPQVDAGLGNTYCKNNIASIPIAGTLAYAAGASWSGGNGGAFGNSGSLSTTYTPSPADITQDSLMLILTSAGSFFACPNDQDTVIIYFTDAPAVNPGSNLVLCSSETIVNLNGVVNGPTTSGIWTTSAAGAFSPSGTQLNAQYLINPLDTLAGSIYLTLESTNNGNCNAVRDSIQITFLGAPTVDITTSDSVCANIGTVNLSGTMTAGYSPTWSTNGAGSIANATLINTVYTVSPIDTTAGSIQIILTTNASICPAQTDTLTLFFADPPRVNAGTDQAFCNNEMVQLNGIIQGVTNTGTWTSTGTGSFNPSPNLTTTAYAPSALDVTNGGVNLILTSTNNGGCNPDVDTISIVFIPSPTAAFSNSNACEGNNMTFTDLSTTTVGSINQWLWDFGDFTTSITNNPVHPYAGSGSYNVTLIATSSNGCKDTIIQSVTVDPNPVASFLVDGPCEGAPVTFTDNSFISSGNVIDWTYDFGDGSSLANGQQIVSHVFPGTSTYVVTLEVTSALGCTDTVMIPVSILQRPDANFSATPNPVLALEDVQFTDLSTSPNSVIIGWTWLFGDSTGSNVQNPIQNYANGGDYDVILVVTDANGCTDSARSVQVVTLMPAVPTAFSPNGDGENDVFRVRGGPFKAINFKVYNNWGQLIFSSEDENVGWDGFFKGEPQPVGVYTWVVDVEITNGRFVNLTGDVTLLR